MIVKFFGTVNNDKSMAIMLFVGTIFTESFFTNKVLHLITIFFFIAVLKAKVTYVSVNYLIHFMTTGFTVRVYVRT